MLLHVKRRAVSRKVDMDFVSEVDRVKYLQLRPTAPWFYAPFFHTCLGKFRAVRGAERKRKQALLVALQGGASESLCDGEACRPPIVKGRRWRSGSRRRGRVKCMLGMGGLERALR